MSTNESYASLALKAEKRNIGKRSLSLGKEKYQPVGNWRNYQETKERINNMSTSKSAITAKSSQLLY